MPKIKVIPAKKEQAALAVITVDLDDSPYLFLEDLPKTQDNPAEYVISMPPMNSSGDVYHMLGYSILAKSHGKQVPRILLAYDGAATLQTSEKHMNTYTQVQRSLTFSAALGYRDLFSEPVGLDTGKCQRENNRKLVLSKYLAELVPVVHYIDQKILTTLIAHYFEQVGREEATKRLRAGFQQRDKKILPDAMNKVIVDRVAAEIKKISTLAKTKPVIVLHFRYSSKANETQNLEHTSLVNQLQAFLAAKGYATWCVFADGRMQHASFSNVKDARTDVFPFKIKNPVSKNQEDWGKVYHLQLVDQLLTLPTLKGMIGNTSGTLDLAGLIGHRVLNLHQFDGVIKYQDYRILIQSSFLSVEFLREDKLNNALRTPEGKRGELTDEIVTEHLPNLPGWLLDDVNSKCRLPKEKLAITGVDVATGGFKELFYLKLFGGVAAKKPLDEMPVSAMDETIERLAKLSL